MGKRPRKRHAARLALQGFWGDQLTIDGVITRGGEIADMDGRTGACLLDEDHGIMGDSFPNFAKDVCPGPHISTGSGILGQAGKAG